MFSHICFRGPGRGDVFMLLCVGTVPYHAHLRDSAKVTGKLNTSSHTLIGVLFVALMQSPAHRFGLPQVCVAIRLICAEWP